MEMCAGGEVETNMVDNFEDDDMALPPETASTSHMEPSRPEEATSSVITSFTRQQFANSTSPHEACRRVVERDKTAADNSSQKRRRQLHRLQALKKENRLLKARQWCRQCRERPPALTLLPCGHFILCEVCGPTFDFCPSCHRAVLADVKTFLS